MAIDPKERKLIERAKHDPEAFAELYDASYDRVFAYILKRCGNYHLAQDIVAETFLKAVKHIAQFQVRDTPFIAWLYRIACNELSAYFRKTGRYHYEELERHCDTIVSSVDVIAEYEQYERGQEYAEMRVAVAQLRTLDQDIITLRFFEEKTIPEIAVIVGLKEGTVKSRLSRALKKIRSLLQRSSIFSVISSYTTL